MRYVFPLTYNRLTVIKFTRLDHRGRKWVECLCQCGEGHEARFDSVRSGKIKSCGCLNREALKRNSWQRAVKILIDDEWVTIPKLIKILRQVKGSSWIITMSKGV